jgi:hypothetical protein
VGSGRRPTRPARLDVIHVGYGHSEEEVERETEESSRALDAHEHSSGLIIRGPQPLTIGLMTELC